MHDPRLDDFRARRGAARQGRRLAVSDTALAGSGVANDGVSGGLAVPVALEVLQVGGCQSEGEQQCLSRQAEHSRVAPCDRSKVRLDESVGGLDVRPPAVGGFPLGGAVGVLLTRASTGSTSENSSTGRARGGASTTSSTPP